MEFQKTRTSEESKEKKLLFEESDAVQFINLFNIYLKRLNINFFDEEEGETEDNSEKEEINKSEEFLENKEKEEEMQKPEQEEKAIEVEK